MIFTSRSPPGSHRPRVALWLRTTLLVPIHAFRCAQCTAPRRTAADRFSGGADAGRAECRDDPNGPDATGRAFGFRDARSGGLPGGELGTTDAGSSRRRREAGESGGVPRCRGLGVDLSSQHDSRARSQYVKGPRPWWRRRPPYSSRRPAGPRVPPAMRPGRRAVKTVRSARPVGRRRPRPKSAALRRWPKTAKTAKETASQSEDGPREGARREEERREEDGGEEDAVEEGGHEEGGCQEGRPPRRRRGEDGDRREDGGQEGRRQEGDRRRSAPRRRRPRRAPAPKA